jgi:hypothetical protein
VINTVGGQQYQLNPQPNKPDSKTWVDSVTGTRHRSYSE